MEDEYSFLYNLDNPEQDENESLSDDTFVSSDEDENGIAPEDVIDAVGSDCVAIQAVCMGDDEEDDEIVFSSNPNVLIDNYWDELIRITIEANNVDDISYKLNRWMLLGDDEEEANESGTGVSFLLKMYPRGLPAGYGVCAADPLDWYFVSDSYGKPANKLQLLFSPNMIFAGNIDQVFITNSLNNEEEKFSDNPENSFLDNL